ncbi:MAG: hypothetical protein OES34_10810, partial [Nitrosopumilus sp.]|nr:hypothetical protein [Nitrosopumilus sp.]
MMFALVSVAQAQWVNPNTNAGTTQVALMLSSNGTVIAPTVVEGLTEFSASLGQIDALSSDTITLPKGGTTIEDWTDIDALLTDDISIEYGANYGTEPEPKGEIYRGKSGNALQMKPLIGVGGITVTDTTEAVYISGDATNGLDALFPVPTNTLYGAFYARGPTPHAMQRISVVNTTNGLLWWNGTNWMLAGSAPAPQATNAALFNGQSAAWWRDMNNHSNMWVFDDGAVQGTITKGFEFGDYLDVTTVVRTNNSREYTLYRINAAGTNVPSNLASSNYWTEWNGFEDDLHLWGRVIVHGQGSANAGQGATVGLGGTNNSASGDYSTVGGGRVNVASGTDSTIAGGVLNDATATGATVAGGRDNEVSGLYSTSIGGWDNDITGQYSGLGGEYNDMSGNLGLGWGVYLGITNHYNYVFGGGQATTNRLTPKVPYAAVFYRYGETMKLGVNVETPTNEVHVLGTVQATDFVGDGSLLTGITAAGGVTNKLVSADGTTYTITNNPSASDVLKIDTATTSAWFSADNDTGAASGMTNQIVSLDGTVYNITNNPTDGQIIAIDASTTSAWFTADSGSGSGGMTNQIVSLDGTIFTITNNPALGDIIHIDTSTTSAWFAADGGASASGMTNQIVSLDGTIFTITNNPTDGQIIAVDASTTSAWFTAESDPLSAKTNDPISIFSNDSGYATRLGETNALNWTNAVHVRVPLTPASAYDAVSKDYADNQAAAAVTNAVDRASFNGGGLQTGLTTLDFVS